MKDKEHYIQLCRAFDGDEKTFENYIKSHKLGKHPDFVIFMDEYIASHGLKRDFIVSSAGLKTNYGYKILNGSKHTSNRNIIIRICLAMRMNLDEIQEALKAYDMRLLDPEIGREKIIIAGIVCGKRLIDIDEWLCRAAEAPLFDDCT